MKAIALVFLESILATAVVIFCLVVPQMLGFPSWAFALSAFPILVYLSWRLRGKVFAWRSAALITVLLSLSMFAVDHFVPAAWHWISWIIIAVLGGWVALRLAADNHHSLPKTSI